MNEQITTDTPELDVPEFLRRQPEAKPEVKAAPEQEQVFVQTAEDKGEGDKPVTVQ